MSNMKQYVNDILDLVSKRDPDQAHFKNTVEEVLTSVVPLLEKHPHGHFSLPLFDSSEDWDFQKLLLQAHDPKRPQTLPDSYLGT